MAKTVTMRIASNTSAGHQAIGASPSLPDAEADRLVAMGLAVFPNVDTTAEVRITYDAGGNVSQIIEQGGDPRGTGTTTINYDVSGDISSVVADGEIITISKDASGNVIGVNIA